MRWGEKREFLASFVRGVDIICIQEAHADTTDIIVLEQWADSLGMVCYINPPRKASKTTLGGVILVKKIWWINLRWNI